MKCCYINLDSAVDRRVSIEKSFAEHNTRNWNLSRFRAIDVEYVVRHHASGELSLGEKACFLSHKSVIQKNIGSTEPIMVMEDDVRFGESTFAVLDVLTNMEPISGWDVLFTDVCVPRPRKMVELIELRKRFVRNKRFPILSLSDFVFAGATSYILNPS